MLNNKYYNLITKLASYCWLLIILVSAIYLAIKTKTNLPIDTDLMSLLPQSQRNQVVDQASKNFISSISQQVILLISGVSLNEIEQSCITAKSSQLFRDVHCRQSTSLVDDVYNSSLPYISGLYSKSLEERFITNDTDYVVNRILSILANPLPGIKLDIKSDPFLLFPEYMANLPAPPENITVTDGYLTLKIDQTEYKLIRLVLNDNLFNRNYQSQVSTLVSKLTDNLSVNNADANIIQAGALKFAEDMAGRAERDVKLISIGSSLALLLVVIFVFFSPAPLFVSALTVASSFIIAFSLGLLVFDKMHIITVAFGASLIGVCSDYSLHFFAHRLLGHNDSVNSTIKKIKISIILGAVTSALGYLGLLLVPFPGLKQMAFFAIAGITCSVISVILLYPFLGWLPKNKSTSKTQYHKKLLLLVDHIWSACSSSVIFHILIIVTILGSLLGWLKINTNDDVRILQSRSSAMVLEEEKLQKLLGEIDQGRFILLVANSAEELHDKDWQITNALKNAGISNFQALANFVPNQATQLQKQQALAMFLKNNSTALLTQLTELGYDRVALKTYFTKLQNKSDYLSIDKFIETPIGNTVKHLAGQRIEDNWINYILLEKNTNFELVKNILNDIPNSYFIDLTAQANTILKDNRITATLYILACYILVLLLLQVKYGFKLGFLAILPASIASITSIGLQAILAIPISLFTILAYTIVLGLAVDYTIFLLEDDNSTTRLVIILSAATTIASFGLLALTSTPVLASFGIALFLGLVLTLALCPIFSVVIKK